MDWKIPLFKTYSDESDIEAVSKVISRGTHWAAGEELNSFEKKLAEYSQRKYALVFNSGTSALHTLLLAHEIKGKEVIVPTFTFISTTNAVILAGGKPIFAESEEDTFGLDIEDVKKKITDKTAAIMIMHYGGIPCRDTLKIKEIAKEKGLLLIEDAAEGLGASINNKMLGSFGNSAIFSFCQNKIISTGEGGAIVTDSKKIYDKALLIRSHGRVEAKEDYFSSTEDNEYIEIGYNFRMPSVLAALGLSQLDKIDKIISLRNSAADKYKELLSEVKEVSFPEYDKENKCVFQLFTIKLNSKEKRDNLQKFLSEKGILTKVYFNPIHLKKFYLKKYNHKEGDLPKTEEISRRVLTLPIYPGMDIKDIEFVSNSIKDYFKNGDNNEKHIQG